MKQQSNILVAYFSRAGMNYTMDGIQNLPVGNTRQIAEMIAKETGGDLFEIKPVQEYPFAYHDCTAMAQKEKNTNARPALTDQVDNLSKYDMIFLGYPNWWSTCPMAVFHFLESYDFSGKLILPFCTHEGSGMGNSEADIQKIAEHAIVKPGLAIRGSYVASSMPQVKAWLGQ